MDSWLAKLSLQIALFLLHFSTTCNLSSQEFKQVSFSIMPIMIMSYSINFNFNFIEFVACY